MTPLVGQHIQAWTREMISLPDASTLHYHPSLCAQKRRFVSIVPAVTKLFTISLQLGKLPAEWKHALVTSIPKSTQLSTVRKYRPVSLLSILSKVLEHYVHSLLMNQLLCTVSPISSSQFEFSRGGLLQVLLFRL